MPPAGLFKVLTIYWVIERQRYTTVVGGHADRAGVGPTQRSGDWFTRVTITGEGRDQVAAGVNQSINQSAACFIADTSCSW